MLESSMKERQTQRIQLNDTPREAVSLLLEILLLVDWIFWTGTTLLGTNISLPKALLKMIFLFPKGDMLVPWRVFWFLKSCFLKSIVEKCELFVHLSLFVKSKMWV